MSDNNSHTSANALILEAAEKSGLLRAVAELLWFADQHRPPVDCAVCELLDRLTSDFDKHLCTPGIVAQQVYLCEGLEISPLPTKEHEVNAFLG